jgi:hypothetical protein
MHAEVWWESDLKGGGYPPGVLRVVGRVARRSMCVWCVCSRVLPHLQLAGRLQPPSSGSNAITLEIPLGNQGDRTTEAPVSSLLESAAAEASGRPELAVTLMLHDAQPLCSARPVGMGRLADNASCHAMRVWVWVLGV